MMQPTVSAVLLALGAGVGCGQRARPAFAGFVDAPVAAVAAQVSGRLVSIEVGEGQQVDAGEIIARLDSRERAAMVVQAEANVERAQAASIEAERNRGALAPAVRGAEADIARQRADLEHARLDFERAATLAGRGAVAPAELETARARLDEARAAAEATLAARLSSRGRLSASEAAILTARAAVRSAEAALTVAQVQLAQTVITSPFAGRVVQWNLEPGEWVAPGTPVMTLEAASRQWVRLDVEETQLEHVQLGAPCEVRVMALPGQRLSGRVTEIGAEAEFALNRDVKRGRPDVRTFRVRVGIEPPDARLRPGMTAEVTIGPAPPADLVPDAGAPAGEPRASAGAER